MFNKKTKDELAEKIKVIDTLELEKIEILNKLTEAEKNIMIFQKDKLMLDESKKVLKKEITVLNDAINNLEKESIELKNYNIKIDNKLKYYIELLSNSQGDIISGDEKRKELNTELAEKCTKVNELNANIVKYQEELDNVKADYIETREIVLLQSFGLYEPKYDLICHNEYLDKIKEIREEQKIFIDKGKVAICSKVWSVEGSEKLGDKLIKDNIKQILLTFNIQCESVISKVKYSNYEASTKKINQVYKQLNKLNDLNKIEIEEGYLKLKLQELDLVFEAALCKQKEKEEIKAQREQRREEIKLAKELEEKRIEIDKEQQHFTNALERLRVQLEAEYNETKKELLRLKEQEIMSELSEIDKVIIDLDYRQANQKAGYVYVISNIGAFGDGVYKIGMTRRLDPQERIDELGGASVPFRFDIHAMIFSDDAPKLEAALHRAFEKNKVNAVNGRKEFFRVTLDEIEKVVKENHDKTVDFNQNAEAQQFRESLVIRK